MKLFSSPLLLFLISTVSYVVIIDAQNSEMDCATAPRDADCVTCLTEGCVHTVGECLSSCDFIADASCWDMQYHENKTVDEVCQQKDTIDADNEICGDESLQSDCGACTSQAKSVEGTCEWYVVPDGPGYCGSGGCGFAGICGSTECSEDGGTDATAAADDRSPCLNFPGCEPCLNSRIECAWIANSCQQSCDDIADAACYHPGVEGFSGMVGPEICAIAVENGDAEPANTEEESPCNGFDYCEPCLNSRIECAWIGGGCEASCDMVADAACYHPGVDGFSGMTGPEICAKAIENGEAEPTPTEEGSPCNGFDYCEPCLNSRIECAWIGGGCEASCDTVADAACYHPGVDGFSGMTGPDICAKAIENGEAEPTPTEEVEEGGPCNGFDFCEPCLNSRIECAWIGGACEPSCDMVADAACYHPGVDGFANMTGPEICAIAVDNGDAKPTPTPAELATATDEADDPASSEDGEEEAASDDQVSAAATSSLWRLGGALSLGFVSVVLL